MPFLIVNTNVAKASIPETFITELSTLMSQLMGKPEKYVSIHISPDQLMTFAGSTEPCALCYVGSVGKLGVEENKGHTEAIMNKIYDVLKIEKDRMYVTFTDLERSNVGWNGKTFAS